MLNTLQLCERALRKIRRKHKKKQLSTREKNERENAQNDAVNRYLTEESTTAEVLSKDPKRLRFPSSV